MAKVYDDNALSIGNTPLVRLNRVVEGHKKVYAKIEGRNPAYSVKCRIGANMIWEAEQSGKLKAEEVLVIAAILPTKTEVLGPVVERLLPRITPSLTAP